MTKSKTASSRLLTEVELELMTILWRIQEGSVHTVQSELPKNRELAYTSVSTILRILEQKGVVGSRKEGRGHIYFPRVSKRDYETVSIHNLVDKVFDGEPGAAVKRLIDTTDLTDRDLWELRKLLDKKMES